MSELSGTAVAADDRFTIHDPRDGSEVGTVASASREEIDRAIATARAALPDWRHTDPEARGQYLHSAARAIEAAAGELAALNSQETGRPQEEALEGIQAGVSTFQQYAELAPVHRGKSLRGSALAADYTVAEPRGVAVVLTPWNDPVAVAAGLLAAALASGNTVIHKPSERCPHLGARLGQILADVLPGGVVTTLTGGPDVGNRLTMSDGVDVFAHVGSSATGERIARAAALTGAYVIRENGGNDPLLVDAGVDPEWAAAQAAMGAFANSGQICTSVERIYVHRDVAEPFTAALTEEAKRRNQEQPLAPLVDTRLRDSVQQQVDDAVRSGARAVEGGTIPSGNGAHYPATVLLDCKDSTQVMSEETFGPVAPVQVVDSFADGLARSAAGHYGLAATVLTPNIGHAQQAIAALQVGTVKVNAVFGGAPGGSAQPRAASGHGFGYGPELLDEFSLVKVVHIEGAPEREQS